MLLASGSVYDGVYKEDKRDGRGTFTLASGDVYELVYKNGEQISAKRL